MFQDVNFLLEEEGKELFTPMAEGIEVVRGVVSIVIAKSVALLFMSVGNTLLGEQLTSMYIAFS